MRDVFAAQQTGMEDPGREIYGKHAVFESSILWSIETVQMARTGQSWFIVGPKKYQKIARMYDRTGLRTKCTLIKTGFKNLRAGTDAKFRHFVDAL